MSRAVASSRYLCDTNVPVCSLEAHEAWSGLSETERLYSHWMSRAAWAGGNIIREQWTPHGRALNRFLLTLFSKSEGRAVDFDSLKRESDLATEDWDGILSYSTQVFSNLCNYRTFGDIKFVPRPSREAFAKLVEACPRAKEALPLWRELEDEIYALEPESRLHIGKPSERHLSNYYPSTQVPGSAAGAGLEMAVNDDDVANVLRVCEREGISSLNTRLRKKGPGDFDLLIASANAPEPRLVESSDPPMKLRICLGDFSEEMSRCILALQQAKKYTEGNENRQQMLENYIHCFETGDMKWHKEGSRHWIRDIGPIVETYIGHIETYVDPWQARAEWEGFTAIVDKKLSARFATLVNQAPDLIKTLPWGADFENDVFRRPDYTGLTILSFATGGIPAGINIPNYDDVRADTGYKNVSLLNVLNAKAPNEEIKFVVESDRQLLEKWQGPTFEVQVACHELLGHGTGSCSKIFREDADGRLNFDKNVVNPLTGKAVEMWYQAGETPNSRIGSVYGAFEEQRAESVGLFLCGNQDILKIFGYTSPEDLEIVPYTNYLLMARAGLRALEFYSPETGKHGQAHMQARLGIFRWLLKDGIISLHIEREKEDPTAISNAYVTVDKTKVLDGTATSSMGRLLVNLQVYRSLGDKEGATRFITELTEPEPEWKGALRDYVLANRTARKCFVQPNTRIADGKVEFIDYPATCEGLLRSCVERVE